MSSGQVLEADDMLARNDHHPVNSATADRDDAAVDVLRDLASRAEVGYQLRYDATMTSTGRGGLAGDQRPSVPCIRARNAPLVQSERFGYKSWKWS